MALTAKKVYAILKRQISDMEAKLNRPVRYRGTVATADLLPLNPDIGDMYNIESKSIYGEAGMNVAWTGEIWDTLGPAIDMAPYLREDSEIITSLETKTENLESANYTDRGTLADTDAFMVNDGTGMKKSVLSKLSDFVLNKIADKVFTKLQTNDKTILGAINELNSNQFSIYEKEVHDLDNPPSAFILNTGTNPKGLPDLGSNGCCVIQHNPGSKAYSAQLAFSFGSDKIAIRRKRDADWTNWTYFSAR